MKYRTKLYIALVGISLACTLLATVVLYAQTKQLLFETLRSEALSIAASTASQINGDLLKNIQSPKDQDSSNYIAVRNQLRKARDANRRDDVFVSSIYTLFLDPSNHKMLLYAVDTEHDPNPIGTPFDSSDLDDIVANLKTFYVDPTFIPDQWGLWLSAYAPIYDSQGNYSSTLGIDISATDVHVDLYKLIKFGITALISAFILSFISAYFLSRQVTHSLDYLCTCVGEIGKGNLNIKTELATHDEFNALAQAINAMTKGLQERERLKMSFARYVSNYILDQILKSETPLKLEGERRKVTVLFSDIRQFTMLAEKLPPEGVVAILNEYFEKMLEIIFRNYGTLDKFIGDGIMAEFGAPLDDPYQEKHAVITAIEMQRELELLCQKWEKEGKPRIQMGVGVHTGDAVVGNIGSEKRTEYTAIGDTVNVASRLEQLTKTLKVPILVSETTFVSLQDHFKHKNLGPILLPGRAEPITVYAIYSNEEEPS